MSAGELPARRLNANQVAIGAELGRGQFKQVNRGRFRGQDVALLLFSGDSACKEIQILLKLAKQGPRFVPQTYGICTKSGKRCLVQELAWFGSVKDLVQKSPRCMSLLHVLTAVVQVADAMVFLESEKVVHADLSCRNVLCFQLDASDPSSTRVKVSDFGLSVELQEAGPPHESGSFADASDFEVIASGTMSMHMKQARAVRWCAPEAVALNRLSHRTDVWSLGATIWEALSDGGKEPWSCLPNRREVAAKLQEMSARLAHCQDCSGACACDNCHVVEAFPRAPACPILVHDLILSCLCVDEFLRPSFAHVAVELRRSLTESACVPTCDEKDGNEDWILVCAQ